MTLTISKGYIPGLPVVAFRFSEAYRTKHPEVEQKWIQTLLRSKGWIVPNYELAPDLSQIEILRVVIRETVSEVLIERLVEDLVSLLASAPAPSTHCPVCRSISPSLLPRPTARPALSTILAKGMASATSFAAGRLMRTLDPGIPELTQNSVKKEAREMKGVRQPLYTITLWHHPDSVRNTMNSRVLCVKGPEFAGISSFAIARERFRYAGDIYSVKVQESVVIADGGRRVLD